MLHSLGGAHYLVFCVEVLYFRVISISVDLRLFVKEQMLLMIVDELADMTDEQEATNANTASNGLGQSRSGSSKIKVTAERECTC